MRERIIVTDRVIMKKALYVACLFKSKAELANGCQAKGELIAEDKIISRTSVGLNGSENINLIFDLPAEIPGGLYTLKINVLDNNHKLLANCVKEIQRENLQPTNEAEEISSTPTYKEISRPVETDLLQPSDNDKAAGFFLFARSALEYVFSGDRPMQEELITNLSINAVKNEFVPLTFSLYSLRDLGNVEVTIDDLTSGNSYIAKGNIKIAYVKSVQNTLSQPKGSYVNLPELIQPGSQVRINRGQSQRFWITLKIDADAASGVYKSTITILPEYGKTVSIPLTLTIAPIVLEDIPGIDYFMMMTYEFTELIMPWKKEDKEKIYQSACRILQDYKDHGMTTICPHSPFVFTRKEDGSPNLDDIFAALRAARDTGFKKPVIWYMGHLIQTSKPKHPGNIIGFDKNIHLARLKELVTKVKDYAAANNCPEVIFLPIDEPDDDYQDYKQKRQNITPLLLKTIHDAGAKSMLTYSNYEQFKPVDYICSSLFDQEQLDKAHKDGAAYLLYNNRITTNCTNPAFARYIYGYYTWANKIDGMSSWTFQNTQNASGLPTKADTLGKDIFLAFPDPAGPLATLRWEAVREGVEDHKLLYQLEKRIKKLKQLGLDTSIFYNFITVIKAKKDEPESALGSYKRRESFFFAQTKNRLVSLIIDADNRLLQY